jgi:hypothetical protein
MNKSPGMNLYPRTVGVLQSVVRTAGSITPMTCPGRRAPASVVRPLRDEREFGPIPYGPLSGTLGVVRGPKMSVGYAKCQCRVARSASRSPMGPPSTKRA